MDRIKPFLAGAALCLVGLAAGACLTIDEPPRRLVPPEELDRINRLRDFYSTLHDEEMTELKARVERYCDIKRAKKLRFGNAELFVSEGTTPTTGKGRSCIWNPDEELLRYGEFDESGKLVGVDTWWYEEHLRSVTRLHVDAEGRTVRVTRGWYWERNNFMWSGYLAQVDLYYPDQKRTVQLRFGPEPGIMARREFADADPETPIGVEYIPRILLGHPHCVIHGARGTEKVDGYCEFPSALIEGADRFWSKTAP